MKELAELERVRGEFGGEAARRKRALMARLARARLGSARAVRRLHEVLLFVCAFADDEGVRDAAEAALRGFARRRDVRRFRAELESSGIAGTDLRYPFYQATAARLAQRFPRQLEVAWESLEDEQEQRLLDRLEFLTAYAESPLVDELDLSLRQWLARLKAPGEADGALLARSLAELEASPLVREILYDEVQPELVLRADATTPSRTLARAGLGTFVARGGGLHRERPTLPDVLEQRPRVRAVSEREGARLIELAQDAMVTRARDLDVFAHGDPRDVRVLTCEDGLEFVAIGFKPERRLLFEAVYGFLTLQNDVPVGYVLNSALFGSAEIAFNVFDAFRGAEAGHVYGWVLACVHHLFGVDTFTIYPYQLGHENEEGIASGAWWFYQRLGFRPRDAGTLALMRRELARQRATPGYRSPPATLRRLARHNVYYASGAARDDVIGVLPLERLAEPASRLLAQRFGARRAEAELELAREAAARLGLRSFRGWSASERLWWRRWAPLLVALPGVERWSPAERRAAVAVVRAKGGRRESDFVRALD
ncbi:MAG: hypothetical protein ABL998_11250, partial [Planctomycetota bacterium]